MISNYWTKSPTFNPQIIISYLSKCACVTIAESHYSTIANCIALLQYLKSTDKTPKVKLPSKLNFVIRVPALTSKRSYKENCAWETKLLQAELVRNGAIHENAALHHMCTGICFVRWFGFHI